MRFVAVYADQRAFVGASYADWVKLPAVGLLIVAVWKDARYRTVYDGADWVWFDGRAWGYVGSVAWDGSYEPKPALPCSSCIKRGDPVSDEEYAAAVTTAMEWTPRGDV